MLWKPYWWLCLPPPPRNLYTLNTFINKGYRSLANAIKNTVLRLQLVVEDFTFIIHHSYILLKERSFSFYGSIKPDYFSTPVRLGTYILSKILKNIVQGSRILVLENNFLVQGNDILVLGRSFPVLEISISCTGMSHSYTGEQFSCTGQEFSCIGEQLSCTGEELSGIGEPLPDTRKPLPKSRNWYSCRVYSLLFSTLHKNDIKQHYYKYA